MHSTSNAITVAACKGRPALPATRRVGREIVRLPQVLAEPPARFQIGAIQGVYRAFTVQCAFVLTPSDSLIYVVLPLRGTVSVATADGTHEAQEGEALLLARAERMSCVWEAGSVGLTLHIPRAAIQVEAARLFKEPRRLGSLVSAMNWSDRPSCLGDPLFDSQRRWDDFISEDIDAHEQILCASLVEAIALGLGNSALPVAKSVSRALDRIRTNPHGAWTAENLASAAGVTAATLRKNFRSCLGLTVTQVVRDARLQWSRERLASPHESRSIARLAEAAGFGGAGAFARAYQQHFGETPTQTRTRAFAGARE